MLVDNVVAETLPEHEAAAEALNAANAEAEAAKRRQDRVAATIRKLAVAIDELAALDAKVVVAA